MPEKTVGMRFFRLIAVVLLATLFWAGCSAGKRDRAGKAPVYRFSKSGKVSVVSFKADVIASESYPVALKQGVWGKILWLAPEGEAVASGDLLVRVDLKYFEDEHLNRRRNLRHTQENLETFSLQTPLELSKVEDERAAGERDWQLKTKEKAWLEQGKPFSERIRTKTDSTRAAAERDLASVLLEFQRKVVARGFDTPFSLRSAEIELKGRDIEAEYSRKAVGRLDQGPLVEERARAEYQAEVASGVLRLAQSRLVSASASRAIERQSILFNLELNQSEVRQLVDRLDQREIFAATSGLVIYPQVWGSKVEPGSDMWEGMQFLTVVATTGYLLDAGVDETLSALLQPGQPASITLDMMPDQVFPGRVTLVGKVPRRAFSRRRTIFKRFPVQLAVDLGSAPVMIGMKATVSVMTAAGEGVFLPRDAVKNPDASPAVLLWNQGRSQEVPIQAESFDADFFRWLDPPSAEGEILFPE
jgi:multidrug resistance efflux pump